MRDLHKKEDAMSATEMENQNSICCFKPSPKQTKILNQMLDFSLFKDPVFMMYAASNFLTSIGFNVPYVFTVVSTRLSSSISELYQISFTGPSIILGHVW